MKLVLIALTAWTTAATALAAATPTNPVLASTMKAVSDDVTAVAVPTTAVDPADILDAQVYTALVRSRTAAYQLQLIIDRRAGEMLPAVLVGVAQPERDAKLATFADLLTKAKAKLADAEAELTAELPKLPENRNFAPLRATLADLGQIEAQAHQIFKPATH